MLTSNSGKTKHRPYHSSSASRAPAPRPQAARELGRGGLGVMSHGGHPCPTGVILSPRENRADGCAAVRGTCSGKSVCLLTREQEGSSFPTHTFLVLCL